MAAFPPPPVTTIDWGNMQERIVHEVNGHIESTYARSTGTWTPLRFVTSPYVHVHGLAPGLNYGQQALEGFKAFRMPGDPGAITLFRPDRNAKRFQHSARVLSMPLVPEDMFLQACRAAVALNACYVPPHESGGALYVRPQLYGSSAQLGLYPPDEFAFRVFVVPTGVYFGTKPLKSLVLDDFDRAAPKGVGHAKVGGNYAPVMRWSENARSSGFDITLHLDSTRRELVDEFSTCAFIGVHGQKSSDHVTLIFPDSPCAINSSTSNSIEYIARQCGWNVERRPVRYTELPEFNEVLGAGTSVGLVPIQSISRRLPTELMTASQGVETYAEFEKIQLLSEEQLDGGPVYLKLSERLRAIQLGKVPDDFGWRISVRKEDQDIDGGAASL